MGKSQPVGRPRVEIDGIPWRVHALQCLVEWRPVLALHKGRVQPFRQIRQAGNGGADGFLQRLLGKTAGVRIDRLDQRQVGESRLVDDVVRMDHVGLAVEPFDPAGNIARFAHRQRLGEVIGVAVEEDQCHLAGLVVNMDAVGNAPVALWRYLVAVNADLERDNDAFGRSGDAGLAAAVDHRMGQMENQIAQDRGGCLFAAAQQPRHRLFDLGANAF